jgi:hypothetical protein
MRETSNASLSALIAVSSAKQGEEQATSGRQHLSCQWQARAEPDKYLHLREIFSFAGHNRRSAVSDTRDI